MRTVRTASRLRHLSAARILLEERMYGVKIQPLAFATASPPDATERQLNAAELRLVRDAVGVSKAQ